MTSPAARYWLMTSAPPPMIDVLAGRRRPSLVECGLDAVGHERERRVRERQRLPLVVREDEDRLVERRVLAPPPSPRLVPQGPGPPPNLPRPMISAPTFANDSSATALLAFSSPPSSPCGSRQAQSDTTHSCSPSPALAERVVEALVRAGDVAVGRDTDVNSDVAHVLKTVPRSKLIEAPGPNESGPGARRISAATNCHVAEADVRVQLEHRRRGRRALHDRVFLGAGPVVRLVEDRHLPGRRHARRRRARRPPAPGRAGRPCRARRRPSSCPAAARRRVRSTVKSPTPNS